MKKQHYIVIAGILIILCLYIFAWRDRRSTIAIAGRYFAVSDTLLVKRIKIEGTQIVELQRTNNSWIINDSLMADPVAVSNFLFIFSRLKIKSITNANGIRQDEASFIIQIDEGRKKRVIYYYKKNGMDMLGRENADRLFITEVSGFPEIRISDVVNDDPFFWRERLLVSMKPQEIAAITMRYPAEEDKNFTVFIQNDSLVLFNPVNNFFYPRETIHIEKLRMFISYFMSIYFEDFVADRRVKDSVLSVTPEIQIFLEGHEGDCIELDIFPRYNGNQRDDRFIYLRKNKAGEILIGKHVLTDLWGKEKGDFIVN